VSLLELRCGHSIGDCEYEYCALLFILRNSLNKDAQSKIPAIPAVDSPETGIPHAPRSSDHARLGCVVSRRYDMQIMLGASEGACFALELEISNESHATWISWREGHGRRSEVCEMDTRLLPGSYGPGSWCDCCHAWVYPAEILPTIFKHPAPAILPVPWHKFMRRGGIVFDQRSRSDARGLR
jgi:hypothetical protein